jgi:hypothetical protein
VLEEDERDAREARLILDNEAFSWNPKLGRHEIELSLRGSGRYRLSFEGEPDASAARLDLRRRQCESWLESSYDDLRRAVARGLLDLYNDTWRERGDYGDEPQPRLDVEGFVSRIALASLDVWDDGAMMAYFDDGDLFAGHRIEVFFTPTGEISDVDIVG